MNKSLVGAVTILRNLENIDFYLLMSGKVCYDELDRIKRVVRKECLRYPTFMRKMASYRKSLRLISTQNGLDQLHPLHNPPAAYLLRLGERKVSNASESKKTKNGGINEKSGSSKRRRSSLQDGKSHKSKGKIIHNDENDDTCDIESFKISSRFVNLHQYHEEEAKRKAETCRIYERFESVTNELTVLDVAIEQKIKDLRDIVQRHRWSSNDYDYKEGLLNQASCDLKLETSLMAFEENLRTMSAMGEAQREEKYTDALHPKISVTAENQTSFESKIMLPKRPFQKSDFNTNRYRSRYLRKKQRYLSPVSKAIAPPQSKPKRKKKSEVLTARMAHEKVTKLKEKFISEVKPDEVIYIEMSDVDEDESILGSPLSSNIKIDIEDEITSELPQRSAVVKNNACDNTENCQVATEEQPRADSPNAATNIKQVPNFILRNKLLIRRASLRSYAGSTAETLKSAGSLDEKKSDDSSSDSDSSRPRHQKCKKNPYSYVVSQYAQHRPVAVQKPKPDRKILTADLCKPFFIQAECLLQAEKVLKKTRSHKSFYPAYKL